jgi:hypothetical protein
MARLRSAPSVVKIAEELRLSGNDPVSAVLGYCRTRVDSWITSFKGQITLARLHQLIDERLSLRHVVVRTDQDLDELAREQLERREVIFGTLKSEFASGTEAITIKLQNPGIGMKQNLAVIDGRGDRAHRVYFGIRHEESHLLSLTPAQLSFVFRRTHATRNDAEERLMDRIGGELAFYPPLFRPELVRLQRRYVQPCFQLVDDVRAEVCPEASSTATAIAVVEQNDVPALFLTARYGSKTSDSGRHSGSWALRASARGNQAAKAVGLMIPWNYRVPQGSIIYSAFHTPYRLLDLHADERLGIWTSSDGSRLQDLPVHVEVRRRRDDVAAIITLS